MRVLIQSRSAPVVRFFVTGFFALLVSIGLTTGAFACCSGGGGGRDRGSIFDNLRNNPTLYPGRKAGNRWNVRRTRRPAKRVRPRKHRRRAVPRRRARPAPRRNRDFLRNPPKTLADKYLADRNAIPTLGAAPPRKIPTLGGSTRNDIKNLQLPPLIPGLNPIDRPPPVDPNLGKDIRYILNNVGNSGAPGTNVPGYILSGVNLAGRHSDMRNAPNQAEQEKKKKDLNEEIGQTAGGMIGGNIGFGLGGPLGGFIGSVAGGEIGGKLSHVKGPKIPRDYATPDQIMNR